MKCEVFSSLGFTSCRPEVCKPSSPTESERRLFKTLRYARISGWLVFDATQLRSMRHGTTNGNTPYSASVTECNWRSTATNTCTQQKAARKTKTTACHDDGKYTHPHGLNHTRVMANHAVDAHRRDVSCSGSGHQLWARLWWFAENAEAGHKRTTAPADGVS
jgi:hypothetical protein